MFVPRSAQLITAIMVGLCCLAFAMLRSGFAITWLHIASAEPFNLRAYCLQMAAYHLGFTIAIVPTSQAIVTRRLAKSWVFYTLLMSCGFLAASPELLAVCSWAIFASRVLIGMLQAAIMPAAVELLTSWLPTAERHLPFTLVFITVNVGLAMASIASGKLVQLPNGWQHSFYAPAVLCGCLAIAWMFLVFDGPSDHPRIPQSKEQPQSASIAASVRVDFWPSLAKVAKSPSFLAILWLHFGNVYASSFVLTALPLFAHIGLGYGVEATSLWLAAMYGSRAIFSMLFGLMASGLMARQWLGKTAIRKAGCLVSHTTPAIAIYAATLRGDQPFECLAYIGLAFMLNGSVTHTSYANIVELVPQHRSALMAMLSGVASCSGILCPLSMVYFLSDGIVSNIKTETVLCNWWPILWIVAALYAVPSLLFIVFGSAKEQPWSENSKSASGPGMDTKMLKIKRNSISPEMYF